ncbi:type II secretion system protein J [Fictibacillus aquaticus]|uniref:Prepilin-type cleavage/methylation domain-containing protein n=1 Tax=Fictibacillus aquaticus TaxID=2021314 RepID=A0A235FED3_9BACL|nr:type II secretion system protein [Fictibacillus aquaticus]OYD59736.1 hypothetical protein CGZ90_07605 [Fictibacillus aquaticus]
MLTKLQNDKGLTMIEVLVGVVLFSIIGTAVYFVLFNGVNTENKLRTETLIRDEADIVMSRLVNEIYALEAAKIEDISTGDSSVLQYKKGTEVKTFGFKNNSAYINNTPITTSDFNFHGSSIAIEKNSILITLSVASNKNENASPLVLESQFGLVEGVK